MHTFKLLTQTAEYQTYKRENNLYRPYNENVRNHDSQESHHTKLSTDPGHEWCFRQTRKQHGAVKLWICSNTDYLIIFTEHIIIMSQNEERLDLPAKCPGSQLKEKLKKKRTIMLLYATAPPPPTPLLHCHIAEASVDAGVHQFTWRPTWCLPRPPAVGNVIRASSGMLT